MVLCGLVSCIDRTGTPERIGAWDPFLADIFNPKISNNCGANTGTLPSNIKLVSCLAFFDSKRVHIKAFSLLR